MPYFLVFGVSVRGPEIIDWRRLCSLFVKYSWARGMHQNTWTRRKRFPPSVGGWRTRTKVLSPRHWRVSGAGDLFHRNLFFHPSWRDSEQHLRHLSQVLLRVKAFENSKSSMSTYVLCIMYLCIYVFMYLCIMYYVLCAYVFMYLCIMHYVFMYYVLCIMCYVLCAMCYVLRVTSNVICIMYYVLCVYVFLYNV